MKRFLASIVLLSLILPSAWPRSAIAGNGEVGSYPNATSPLNGTERIPADQSSSGYPCTSCTVNITPLQLSNFTAAQAPSFGLLFNNAGAIGGSTYLTWNGSSNVFNVGATSTPGTVSVGALDSMIVNGTPIPVPGFALNSNIQGVIENHSYTTGTSAGAARLYLARSDGSITSPSIVVNGDHLGTIYGVGFNGTTNNYLAGGYMQFIVDGTPSGTAMPSDWILALAGATGAPAQVMRAYSNGGVVVGAPTGGNEGAGTINMAGCYINGVACAASSFTVDTAPSGISVTPPCTYNMVKVTATDYQIAAPVQSAPTTSSTGGSLTGSTYYYVVTATTSAGQTTASAQQSIASDTLAPPTIGTATDSTTGGTGLSPSTTYYYVVTALNANGQTLASGEVSATTSTGSTDSITVTWTAVSGATGYNVYRGTASNGENVYYSAGNVTSFTDTGATSTSGSPPGVNTAYLTSTNENVISWAAVTGATGYVVYRSTTSGNFTNATSYTVSGGTTVTFTDTGATGTTATPPTANTSGQFTINAPSTCTPTDGQKLELKIISPSGGIVTYAFNSAYLASGSLALPTTSYAAGKEDYFQTQYDADKSDWVVLSYNQGF